MSCDCLKDSEPGYDLCKECINTNVSICTCNKEFLAKPTSYIFANANSNLNVFNLPDPIPNFFYKQIGDHLFHILGCRGCRYTKESKSISVLENFPAALQASITSCVYQKYTTNNEVIYQYLSDSIHPDFEDYCEKQNITLGVATNIVLK